MTPVVTRVGQRTQRVYVMGQRTRGDNRSFRSNLSFNSRLILAPDYMLRYLVAHAVVLVAIPDHSAKSWLTVQSLCRTRIRRGSGYADIGRSYGWDWAMCPRGRARSDVSN